MNTLHERLAECDALRARLGSLRPLPVEALKKIEDALNIEYTYESNRIEGNTLTLQETALVVNEGVTIAGKSMREHLEAINHAEAIDYIKDFARNDTEISERTIKEIHAIVLHGIDRENAGRYRTVPVMISGSTHTPPQPYLIAPQMEAFMLRFAQMEAAKEHPIIIAAYAHGTAPRGVPPARGKGRGGFPAPVSVHYRRGGNKRNGQITYCYGKENRPDRRSKPRQGTRPIRIGGY